MLYVAARNSACHIKFISDSFIIVGTDPIQTSEFWVIREQTMLSSSFSFCSRS